MGDGQSGESQYIMLKILGQDEAVIQFKIKRHTCFRRLMTSYCERSGISMQVIQLRYDGNPISEDDTPSMLNMVEGDAISVFYKRTGES